MWQTWFSAHSIGGLLDWMKDTQLFVNILTDVVKRATKAISA